MASRAGSGWDGPATDPVLLAALGLAAGIVVGDRCEGDEGVLLAIALLALALLALRTGTAQRRAGRRALAARSTILLGMIGLGLARTSAPVSALPVPPIRGEAPLATVCGRVAAALMPGLTAPPARRAGGKTRHGSFLLRDTTILAGAGPLAPVGLVKILVPMSRRFLPRGARVQATGVLLAPRARRNPGEADGERLRRRRGIAAVLLVSDPSALELLEPPVGAGLLATVDAARARILAHLHEDLEPDAAALSAALLLGVRDGLDQDLRDAVAGTGLIHLLAISGLHVLLVVGAARGLCGLLLPPRLADLTAILLAVGYAALAGAGSPIVRAAVGCAVHLAGRCVGRRARPFSTLALAAILLLLADPGELFRPGFQLSFAAVFALSLAAGSHRPAGSWRQRWLSGPLATSATASLATAPLVLFHFGRLALLGPILTLIVTPLFLASFGLILVHGLLGACWDRLGGLLAAPTGWLARGLISSFDLAHRLPLATLTLQRPSAPAALLLLGAAFLCLGRRWLPATLLLFVVTALDSPRRRPPAMPELWMFDVGHGQAVLLRTACGRNILFDCGSRGTNDLGRRTILPALDALGVVQLDLLVLSHADADHLNGAAELIRAGRVRSLVTGDRWQAGPTVLDLFRAGEEAGLTRQGAAAGELLLDDPASGLRIEVLAPPPDCTPISDNDDSLVLRVEIRGFRLLLPGDLEERGLRRLIDSPAELDCDLLILPHHGHPDPLLGPFLHRARPKLALASRPEPFRRADVPALVERVGGLVWTTANRGAIRVRIRTDRNGHAAFLMEGSVIQQVTAGRRTRYNDPGNALQASRRSR